MFKKRVFACQLPLDGLINLRLLKFYGKARLPLWWNFCHPKGLNTLQKFASKQAILLEFWSLFTHLIYVHFLHFSFILLSYHSHFTSQVVHCTPYTTTTHAQITTTHPHRTLAHSSIEQKQKEDKSTFPQIPPIFQITKMLITSNFRVLRPRNRRHSKARVEFYRMVLFA